METDPIISRLMVIVLLRKMLVRVLRVLIRERLGTELRPLALRLRIVGDLRV